MKKVIFTIMTGFVFLVVSLALAEDVPMMLNYQGYVEDTSGTPLDGPAYLKFAIVNAAGDTTYWSNDGTSTNGNEPNNAVTIPATNGFFTVKLGNANLTNMVVLPTTPFDQQEIYVRVWFSDDNVTFEQMSPDTQIVSAGFAYKAQTVVDNAVTSAIIQNGTITNADISGSAGISASKIDTTDLDADTLDGNNSSAFATATHSHAGSDITSGTIPNDRLDSDLQDLADGTLSASKVQYGDYFINSAGTSGQVWKSDGSGKGQWSTDNTGGTSESSVESYIANDVNTNYVPRDNGTKLVTGTIYDNGVRIGIGTSQPSVSYKLTVDGGGSSYGILVKNCGDNAIEAIGYNYGLRGTGNSIGVIGDGKAYDFYATGSGTNYGPFTAGHEVKLASVFPQDVVPGMIVSVTGETRIRQAEDGAVSISSTLPTVTLAHLVNDKGVFGVFVTEAPLPKGHWYQREDGERFAIVNALGEGRVWVSNINGDIQAGDYITTSPIPGYGQRQNDDLLHSYTLAKAIETADWNSLTETIQFNGQTYKIYLVGVVYTSG